MSGGKRVGAGRPATLEAPQVRQVRLEARQIRTVQRWADARGINWSAALRQIIDAAGQVMGLRKGRL